MRNSKPTLAGDLTWLPAASVHRWDRNPRRHPERQIRALAGLMRRVGFVNPVVVWGSKGRLVSGHGRLDAVELIERETPGHRLPNAPAAGMVRVLVHEFASEADATLYALADNRLPELAEDDAEELATLQGEMDATDRELAGFGSEDRSEGESIAVHEIETSELVSARFWLSVSGPLPSQPEAIERLRVALAELPDCDVAFGSG